MNLVGRPPAQRGAPPEHAPLVYRAAALALQLLQARHQQLERVAVLHS